MMEAKKKERRKVVRRKAKRKAESRCFDRRERVFFYDRKIYLSDTNTFRNVYFANFFDFIGEAREELLQFLVGSDTNALIDSGVLLITKDCNLNFLKPLFLYDEIRVEIRLIKITKYRIAFQFDIKNKLKKESAATGSMTVVSSMDDQIIPLPNALYQTTEALFIQGKHRNFLI